MSHPDPTREYEVNEIGAKVKKKRVAKKVSREYGLRPGWSIDAMAKLKALSKGLDKHTKR